MSTDRHMVIFGRRRNITARLAVLIASCTFAVYLPALKGGFVNWDDGVYVYENVRIRSLGLDFFRWAFTSLEQGFWHPVTWISHAIDYALWGLNPIGHHLSAISLHAINTYLVVRLVGVLYEAASQMPGASSAEGRTGNRSVLITAGSAGLLFGIHPLHVESVAWIAERKDLLCGMFYLLSIMSYVRYAVAAEETKNEGEKKGFKHYILSFVFFVLSLASKTMGVSLPIVLLLLDWYPLQRLRSHRNMLVSLAEKVPFLACGLLISVVSVIAQKTQGALALTDAIPLTTRILVAFKALCVYLWKMLIPVNLLPLYPYPEDVSIRSVGSLTAVVLVAGIAAVCMYMGRKSRLLPAVWGYYVITILPVLGIIQFGIHPWADRFTYLPSLGPFLLVGLSASLVWERIDSLHYPTFPVRRLSLWLVTFFMVFISYLTVKQVGIWHSSIDLWSHVIAKEPYRVATAYVNRGAAFGEMNRINEALADFEAAISIAPDFPLAYNNRGYAFMKSDLIDRAIRDYTTAIQLDPSYYAAYNNRGLALRGLGRLDEAETDFTAAIAARPDFAAAYVNRGLVYAETGRADMAIEDLTSAISANPYYSEAYVSRGLMLERIGRLELAIADYDRAIDLNPSDGNGYVNRGVVYDRMNQPGRALKDYNTAIFLDPGDALAYYNRGMTFAKMGRNEEAQRDYRKACEMGSSEGCAAAWGHGTRNAVR